MGTKYTTNSISGYNSSPPPDDGTTGDNNKVTWAKHKTKLTDPIKTLTEAIDTDLVTHFDVDSKAKSSNYTTVADDNNRMIECTTSPTITLGAAASMGTGYRVTIKNAGSGTVTVATGEDIDGSASNRTLGANEVETYTVDAGSSGYNVTASNVAAVTQAYVDLRAMTHHATFNTTGTQQLGETTTITTGCHKIEVLFRGVSLDTTTDAIRVELGDSTGYAAAAAGGTTRFGPSGNTLTDWTTLAGSSGPAAVWENTAAGQAPFGLVTLTKVNGANLWVISSNLTSGSSGSCIANGNINNIAEVTKLKITSNTGNFDGSGIVEVKTYHYDD